MFNLIRRISHSVIPRPDRPWEDDPTSNAPNTRRKRRLSSTERMEDTDDELARKKKLRGESTEADLGSEDTPAATEDPEREETEGGSVSVRREGSLEVKDVTEGVKEVELKDKEKDADPNTAADASDDKKVLEETKDGAGGKRLEAIANPESVPLPEEKVGEWDEPHSSSSPQAQLPPPQSSNGITTKAEEPASGHGADGKKLGVDDREDGDSVAERPSTPVKSSTRKTRSSPKKVTKAKA